MTDEIERTKKALDFIVDSQNDPLVQRILSGKTRLETEFEKFYDFHTKMRAAPRVGLASFAVGSTYNPDKKGKRPEDLIRLIDGINGIGLNEEYDLTYESVRRTIGFDRSEEQAKKHRKKYNRDVYICGGLFVGAPFLLVDGGRQIASSNYLLGGLLLALGTLAIIPSYIRLPAGLPPFSRTAKDKKAFYKCERIVCNTDDFVYKYKRDILKRIHK